MGRKKIIIIDDGQTMWGAYASDLFTAMRAGGWTIDRNRVTNPPTERDECGDMIGEDAYTALCQNVSPVCGYDPRSLASVPARWRNKASLTFWPSDGPDCWVLDA